MRIKDTYLSVDLDYWHTAKDSNAGELTATVLKLCIPVSVYIDHHRVLKDLRGKSYVKVINIDEHDDLPSDLINKLDEGTWVGRVPFRRKATYEWRYPVTGGSPCDGVDGDTTWGPESRRQRRKEGLFEIGREGICGWKKLQRRPGLADIEFDRIAAASFILSPAYVAVAEIKDALTALALKQDRVSCSKQVRSALNRVLENKRTLFSTSTLTRRRLADSRVRLGGSSSGETVWADCPTALQLLFRELYNL
jgi:hypothetical protein